MREGSFEAIVYFLGPLSKWAGRPDDREIIYSRPCRFRSIALGLARGRARGLANCLWIVRHEGVVVAGELPERLQL